MGRHKCRDTKKSAYGSKRTKVWCDKCDENMVSPSPSKKRVRMKTKKEIKKELI